MTSHVWWMVECYIHDDRQIHQPFSSRPQHARKHLPQSLSHYISALTTPPLTSTPACLPQHFVIYKSPPQKNHDLWISSGLNKALDACKAAGFQKKSNRRQIISVCAASAVMKGSDRTSRDEIFLHVPPQASPGGASNNRALHWAILTA